MKSVDEEESYCFFLFFYNSTLVNSEASEQEIELLIENKTTKLFVDNVSGLLVIRFRSFISLVDFNFYMISDSARDRKRATDTTRSNGSVQ